MAASDDLTPGHDSRDETIRLLEERIRCLEGIIHAQNTYIKQREESVNKFLLRLPKAMMQTLSRTALIPHKQAVTMLGFGELDAKQESKYMEKIRNRYGIGLRPKNSRVWKYQAAAVARIAEHMNRFGKDDPKESVPTPQEILRRAVSIRKERIHASFPIHSPIPHKKSRKNKPF